MFFKIILGLALFIVIAALGANSGLGEGFFGFKAKGKAADLVEFTRDLTTVMQTFKADDNTNRSVVNIIEAKTLGAGDASATDNDNIPHFLDVVGELQSDDLLKGNGQYEIGAFATTVIGNADDEDIILVNTSDEITDQICDKLNEVLGNPEGGVGSYAADLTAAGMAATGDSMEASLHADFLAAATAQAVNLVDGGAEGVCIKDTGGNLNTFAYYVQKL